MKPIKIFSVYLDVNNSFGRYRIFSYFYIQVKDKKMKKISLIAAVLFLMVLGMSSCKSTEDCPAYGYAEVVDDTERA